MPSDEQCRCEQGPPARHVSGGNGEIRGPPLLCFKVFVGTWNVNGGKAMRSPEVGSCPVKARL
jgi:hypothetical protein